MPRRSSEVVKSIQNSQIGRHEPMKQGLMFKPVNLYGSKWLQRQPVAELDLPRTLDPAHSSNAKKYGLPGPLFQDNDEDSSPFVQDWDLADHVPCSTRDMTTSGHDDPTLTHSLGTRAHGSENSTSQNAKLTATSRKAVEKNAKLT